MSTSRKSKNEKFKINGALIKFQSHMRRLKLSAIARALHVSAPTFSRYVNGTLSVNAAMLAAIAEVVHLPKQSLILREGCAE